jgi:uncharacterized protein YpmS
MRTTLTQEQVTAIIEAYFEDQGVTAHYMVYLTDQDGVFEGCVVDHDFEIELPDEGARVQ